MGTYLSFKSLNDLFNKPNILDLLDVILNPLIFMKANKNLQKDFMLPGFYDYKGCKLHIDHKHNKHKINLIHS